MTTSFAWMIGCTEHGISKEMSSKVKDALKLMNDLTCEGDPKHELFQAPDFVSSISRNIVEFKPHKARDHIWLVTSGICRRHGLRNIMTNGASPTTKFMFKNEYISKFELLWYSSHNPFSVFFFNFPKRIFILFSHILTSFSELYFKRMYIF